MKKLIIFLTVVLCAINIGAQAPSAFNYQALLRDASGNIRANASVNIRIDLLQTSASGTTVYSESFSTNTNTYGLVNLQIGKGTVISGTFATIDWGNGLYFIKVSVDGTEMGTSQLLAVPYAKYAEKAGNGFSGSYNDLTNKPTFTETDPVYAASLAKNIKAADTTRWGNKSNFNGDYNDLTNKPLILDARYNTAAGYQVLKNNTTGEGNAANGYQPLYYNTTGNYNTTSGFRSLFSNTTGNYNTAIGSYSLHSNTIGNWNVAIGSGSLRNNKTADKNTAIGYEALKSATFWDNTAVGYQALLNNTEGFDNSAVGVNALDANYSGEANTAIGKNAMRSMVTGNNNTAIGFNSDITNNASNSTAIGNGATVNVSNKIRLGNNNINVIEGQVAFTSASDMRLKKNIKDITTGTDFIMKLRPVEYQMNQGDEKINFGFLAQDIEKLLGTNNSLLTISGDTDRTLGLRYTDFIAPLVKTVQEHQKQIESQQKQIDELKRLVEKLLSK